MVITRAEAARREGSPTGNPYWSDYYPNIEFVGPWQWRGSAGFVYNVYHAWQRGYRQRPAGPPSHYMTAHQRAQVGSYAISCWNGGYDEWYLSMLEKPQPPV